MFQFQLGAIGRQIIREINIGNNEFQFQLGAIGSVQKILVFVSAFNVSIPAWCDWESQSAVSTVQLVRFNSSLVRLGVV